MLRSLVKVVVDALFPLQCVGCGKSGTLICQRCESTLPRHLPPYCSLCAKPLDEGEKGKRRRGERVRRNEDASGGLVPRLCFRCQRAPLAIDGIRSVFRYDGVVRNAILRLKYHGVRSLAGPLGAPMGDYLLADPFPVDAIIPVPLHARRLRERGYNQSALLARQVAKASGLKLEEKALVRVKDTPSQVRSASIEERRQNVHGAFHAVESEVKDRCILVVDDVCTTGSTLEACSLALRKAGAKSVWGLTLARET